MTKVFATAVIVLACSLATASAGDKKSARHNINIKDMQFDPATVEVAPGDTVVWTNQDDRDHTVGAKDGSFKSGNLNRGETFEYAFKKAGKFGYACSYHPRMKGTIVVNGD